MGTGPWGYIHVGAMKSPVFLTPPVLNDGRFLGAAFDELFLETALFDEQLPGNALFRTWFLETALFLTMMR